MQSDSVVHVQLVAFLWDEEFNRKPIGKPIRLTQVPRVGEYISSDNKAYLVESVIHVENDYPRVVVRLCDTASGTIARYSDPNR